MKAPELLRISDYVDHWARQAPDREAWVLGASRATYRDLSNDTDRWARALLAAGVRRGDRVAVRADPTPDYWIAFLAIAGIGAIYLGLNPKQRGPEIAHVVSDASPVIVVDLMEPDGGHPVDALSVDVVGQTPVVAAGRADVRAAFLQAGAGVDDDILRSAREAVGGGDAAALVYTSGSTGQPKGALLPHRGLVRCCVVQGEHWFDGLPPRMVINLPVNHVGCVGDVCASTLVAGGTLLFQRHFDPVDVLDLIARECASLWGAVPAMFSLSVHSAAWASADLSSLRRIVWSGGAMPLPLARQLNERCSTLLNCYGMTETVGSITFTDDADDLETLTGTVGRPEPAYDVRLVAEDGHVCRAGEEGEIRVRGDFVFLGYLGQPEATSAAFDADGYLKTGDVGLLRSDGNVVLVGRTHDMFKSGGYNVYPREIELALEAHPGVLLAAVIAVPDETFGEVGHGFVTVSADVTAEQLREFLRDRLANYKVPKQIVVMADMPVQPIGKVDKRELARHAHPR